MARPKNRIQSRACSVRLTEPTIARADKLAEHLFKDEAVIAVGGEPTRSAALRLAVETGLVALEAKYRL